MDCIGFEEIVGDLARGAVVDPVRAMEHCSTCKYCAARLTAERVVADQLADFARRLERRGAPSVVEDRLLRMYHLLSG